MAVRITRHILLSLLLLATIASSSSFAATSINFTASATILSKNQCRFLSNNFTLDFGNLAPTSGASVNASATVDFRCRGSDPVASYSISDDDGLHETGPNANRMQSAVNPAIYIPYSLSLNPLNGNALKNVSQTLTVSGTINGPDYQFAIPGVYTDLVVISILP